MMLIYCANFIYFITNFNDMLLGSVLGSFFSLTAFFVGFLLMYRGKKAGFYLYSGALIIVGVSLLYIYGFLDYHVTLLSKEASVLLVILSMTFQLILLLLFMLIKKNGRNAFHVLWDK